MTERYKAEKLFEPIAFKEPYVWQVRDTHDQAIMFHGVTEGTADHIAVGMNEADKKRAAEEADRHLLNLNKVVELHRAIKAAADEAAESTK